MYYQARLMIGESLFRIEAIEDAREYLRVFAPLPIRINVAHSPDDYMIPSMQMTTAVMIFRLDAYESYGQTYTSVPTLIYRFVFTEGTEKFSCPMRDTIDIDFPPDDKVNLNNLKAKFRQKEKMKKLLIKYYNS